MTQKDFSRRGILAASLGLAASFTSAASAQPTRPVGREFLPPELVAGIDAISVSPNSPRLQPKVALTFALALAFEGTTQVGRQASDLETFMQRNRLRDTPLLPSNLRLWAEYTINFEAMAQNVLNAYDDLLMQARRRYPNVPFPTRQEVQALKDTASRIRPDICFRVTGDRTNQTCAGYFPQRP